MQSIPRLRSFAFAVAVIGSLVGCATPSSTVRDSFASTYRCPSEQSTVASARPNEFDAIGCGHAAKYVCTDGNACHEQPAAGAVAGQPPVSTTP